MKETAFLDTAPGATAGSQIDRTIARRSDAVSGAWTISVPGILRTIPPRRKRLLMKSKGWRMCSRNELSILLSGRGLRPAVLSLPNRQHRSSAAREEQSR